MTSPRRVPRVALDLHMVGGQETGNETYAAELGAALGRNPGCDTLLYTPRPQAVAAGLVHARVRRTPDVPSAVRLGLLYPWLARRDRVDLIHVTYAAPPLFSGPTVVTVHDVSYRIYPEFFSPRVRATLEALVGRSVRRAARVIAISENTRRDLVRLYGLPPDRVVVTHLAAARRFEPQAADRLAQVRSRLGLPDQYVLAVGNLQPRKNLGRLVDAFAGLAAEHPDLCLVLVGKSAWRGSDVASRVSERGIAGRVVMTGYVEPDDLPAVYAGSQVFCYPSLYEGFGLPAVEAMACGAPTLTSDTSCMPEVVGDAAVTVDPTSVDAIAGGLRRLLDDPDLRARLAARGMARARTFSWDRTAGQTVDVYRAVVGLD